MGAGDLTGRRAFAEYLSNLERALNWQPRT